VEGSDSPKDGRPKKQTDSAQPRVIGEFEVRERGVALRMRVERLPSPPELSDDEAPIEAGYGHGV
jgi:hypothetical protein